MGFAYKLVLSLDEDTGYENILDLPIKKVKQTTIAFEDQAELGVCLMQMFWSKIKTPLFLDEIWDQVRANVLSVIDQLKNVLALGGILLQKCKIIFLNYMQRM